MNMNVSTPHLVTRRHEERGFTLIELMVALTFGLLLMTVQIIWLASSVISRKAWPTSIL